MSEQIQPFQCQVADDVLADLKARLARTRWPDQLDGAGWDYGTERGYLEELTGASRAGSGSGCCWRSGSTGHTASESPSPVNVITNAITNAAFQRRRR